MGDLKLSEVQSGLAALEMLAEVKPKAPGMWDCFL